MLSKLLASEARWIHALLVLSTVTVALILAWIVALVLGYFSDVLLMLVLAWLFAFILSPLVGIIQRAIPRLPRTVAVVVVYFGLFVVLSIVVVLAAGSLAPSIRDFLTSLPTLRERLPVIVQPWQDLLNQLGFGTVNLTDLGGEALNGIGSLGAGLPDQLTNLAFKSLSVVGNLLLIVFLSLFIVLDKDEILAFVNRLIPPRWANEARLFETSVSSSFGGFLRGQVIQGLVFGAFAAAGSLVLHIDYLPATTALVVILQIIPFFGPFFSWAPPVVVAALSSDSSATLPIFIIMAVGWFITMNIVQPRVMARTVGIHPVMVLASVLVGLRIADVIGAIFAIPVAAVVSNFFFHYLNRSVGGPRDVASRAARRLEKRQGRHIRVPTAPGVEIAAAGPGGPGRLVGGGTISTPPSDGIG